MPDQLISQLKSELAPPFRFLLVCLFWPFAEAESRAGEATEPAATAGRGVVPEQASEVSVARDTPAQREKDLVIIKLLTVAN